MAIPLEDIIAGMQSEGGYTDDDFAGVTAEYNKNNATEKADEEDEVAAAKVLPEFKIESPKADKFNPLGFLNLENKQIVNENSIRFFNQEEEEAKIQLQKILGDQYVVKESGVTFKEFFTAKGKSKSADQIIIRHKDDKKKDSVKISFNIGAEPGTSETKQLLYSKSAEKLFDYVNKTMSIEDISKSQTQQAEVLEEYNKLNAPAVISNDGQVIEQAGPLHVSQEEKNRVTSKFDAEDLFTPITKQTNVSLDPKYPKVVDRTEQPFEDELKRAKQQLVNDGIKDPTEEQIQGLARNTLTQEAVQDIYDQKATDYMNSDEVEETDFDAMLKLGALMKQKITFNDKKVVAKNQLKITNSVTQFEKDQLDPNTDIFKANEFIKIINSTEATVYDVDKIEKVRVEKETELNLLQKSLESGFKYSDEISGFKGRDPESFAYKSNLATYNQKIKEYNTYIKENKSEERVVLENGTVMPKSKYDSYLASLTVYNKQLNNIIELEDQNAIDISRLKEDDIKYDLVKRNYNDAEKFISTIGHGFGEIAMKAAYASSKFQSGLFGIDNKSIDKEFLIAQESSSMYREKYQKDIKFENAFSKKNFGKFLLQETQNQIPIFATLAMGPMGYSILGLSGAGENWARMVQEDKFYGNESWLLNKMLTSGGYGAAEVVFDRYLTLPVMQRSAKALFGTMKNFRTATKTGMLDYAKKFGKRQLIYDPVLEITAESGTTLFQNLITGRPLTENLAHAAFSGGLFGVGFGHVPFYKGLVMQKFSDYNSFSGFRTNLNKIANLQITAKKLNTSLKANKTKGNDTTAIESNIETVNAEIESLNQENESTLKTVEKKVNNLSKKWFNIYNEATVEQEQIRIDVESIVKDESLSDIEKQGLIDIKQKKFDTLQATRDVLRDDKNFGNAYAAFRNSNAKEDQDRLQEIQGQATSELIDEGALEPKDDAIDARTKIIYNTQEINKDYNSKKSMLDGANFQHFQNVEKAVAFVNKMDISDADKQDIISNIEDGAHGVNVVGRDNAITPMQIVENMAKDDRLETRTHETGHLVFAAAFGNNKQAFDGIAESVLDFVKERNANLHLRLLNQVERDASGKLISEEVLTNFLELVAEGKIDFDANKNKGLGAFIANALNIGTKKSLGEKADFNFEGETDAVNFLIKLGKKIKAGTLTIKDIETIKDVKIAEKVETKPEITYSKKTPEQLIKIIKRKSSSPKQIKEANNALVPQYEALAVTALKYDESKGDILRENVVSATREYYNAIVKNYDPKKGAFSTHVTGNIAPKNDTIFEKAKTLEKRDESVSIDAGIFIFLGSVALSVQNNISPIILIPVIRLRGSNFKTFLFVSLNTIRVFARFLV